MNARRIALAVLAKRDLAGLHLTIAGHEDVGDLADLGVADAPPERLGPVVELGARSALPQARRHRGSVVGVAVGDRQHDGLDRRQPHREFAGVMLDEDADEALEGAKERAVDHHGLVLGVVRAGVLQVEAVGHLVVELDGAELPGASDRVGHV